MPSQMVCLIIFQSYDIICWMSSRSRRACFASSGLLTAKCVAVSDTCRVLEIADISAAFQRLWRRCPVP